MALTRKEIIEIRARAICEASGHDPETLTYHMNDGIQEPYGDMWVHFIQQAKAIIEADEKAGVLMLVCDRELVQAKDVVLSGIDGTDMRVANYIDHVKDDRIFKKDCEGIRWAGSITGKQIIQRANTPVYQCKTGKKVN